MGGMEIGASASVATEETGETHIMRGVMIIILNAILLG
jgi:hypothetical protein